MSLTYSSYVTSMANLMVVPTTDPAFQTMLPNMIDDAELRCYRALNLLDETVRDSSCHFHPEFAQFHAAVHQRHLHQRRPVQRHYACRHIQCRFRHPQSNDCGIEGDD